MPLSDEDRGNSPDLVAGEAQGENNVTKQGTRMYPLAAKLPPTHTSKTHAAGGGGGHETPWGKLDTQCCSISTNRRQRSLSTASFTEHLIATTTNSPLATSLHPIREQIITRTRFCHSSIHFTLGSSSNGRPVRASVEVSYVVASCFPLRAPHRSNLSAFRLSYPLTYRRVTGHVFGQTTKREQCYDNLRVSRNAWDTNLIKANPKYLAVNWEAGGGGAFAVIPLEERGKLPDQLPLFRGHTAVVLDTDWSPFDDSLIASASDDGKVFLWQVPEDFALRTEAEEIEDVAPIGKLSGHSRCV